MLFLSTTLKDVITVFISLVCVMIWVLNLAFVGLVYWFPQIVVSLLKKGYVQFTKLKQHTYLPPAEYLKDSKVEYLFCSRCVAETLMHGGVLKRSYASGLYLPKDFLPASAGYNTGPMFDNELVEGYMYDEKLLNVEYNSEEQDQLLREQQKQEPRLSLAIKTARRVSSMFSSSAMTSHLELEMVQEMQHQQQYQRRATTSATARFSTLLSRDLQASFEYEMMERQRRRQTTTDSMKGINGHINNWRSNSIVQAYNTKDD